MAKDYYEDPYFNRENDGSINLWKVYNLFTQTNKSSYIDTFLYRNRMLLSSPKVFKTASVDKSWGFELVNSPARYGVGLFF